MSDDPKYQLSHIQNQISPGSFLASVLQQLKPEDLAALRKKAAEGMLAQDLAGDERLRRLHLSAAELELFIRQIKSLDVNPETHLSATTQVEGPTGTTRIEVRKGAAFEKPRGACFVATAVYGTASHPDVIELRRFRDQILSQNTTGRKFCAWYYRYGPRLAASPLVRVYCKTLVRHVCTLFCWLLRRRS